MRPLFPSLTAPAGFSVLPVPMFLLSNVCVKAATSPVWMLPGGVVGTAADRLVPSYSRLSVAAVTVIARRAMFAVVAAVVGLST